MRRALQQAEGDLSTYERNVDKYLGRSEKRFQTMGTRLTTVLKGAGIAAAATGAFELISRAVEKGAEKIGEVASLKGLADAAGVTVEQFQLLKAAFAEAGVEQERLGQGLSEFARHVQEAKTQNGEYYEFLRTSLPTVLDQVRGAQSQTEALNVVADAVRRLGDEQARILLTQKSFGDAGTAWVGVLKGGSEALTEAANKARAHNLILQDNSVEAARKATHAYRELTEQLDVEMKQALIAILPYVNDMLTSFNRSAEAVRGFRSAVKDAGDASIARANPEETNSLKALNGAIDNVTRQLQAQHDALNETSTFWDKVKNNFFDTERQAQKLEVELYNLLQRKKELTSKPVTLGDWKTEVNADVLNMRTKPDYTGADAIARAARSRADAEQEAFLAIRHTMDQELEEYRRLHEDRRLTDEQYAKIRVDVEAAASARVLEAIKKERDVIAQQLQPFRDVIEQSLTDPLRDAFDGSLKSMNDYFHQLAANMALAIQKTLVLKPLLDGIQNSLAGAGGATGFLNAIGLKGFGQSTMDLGQINGWQTDVTSNGAGLGNLFAGFRADGGPVVPGMGYNVGEHGVERFVPTVPGYIVPGRTSDGGSVVNIAVDARGSDISVAERTERAVQAASRTIQDPVQAQRSIAKRFPYRR